MARSAVLFAVFMAGSSAPVLAELITETIMLADAEISFEGGGREQFCASGDRQRRYWRGGRGAIRICLACQTPTRMESGFASLEGRQWQILRCDTRDQ